MEAVNDTKAIVPKSEKLGLKEKLAYGAGDVGNGLMFQLAQLYLLKFYTDVLGISAYWGGLIFLITKFVDAITDTLIGSYVDARKVGPKGKFKPYILYGTGFLALATVATFLAPDLSQTGKIVFAFATYNLMSIAYTIVNIPYGSLSSAMTTDSADRTSLAVFRNLGGQLAALGAGVIVIPLVNQFADPKVGYPIIVAVISLIGVAAHLFCYKEVKERVVSKVPRKKGDGIKAFKGLFTNIPFVVLCVYTLLSIGAMFLKQGIQLYYFQYALGNEGLVSIVSLLSIVGIIPSVLFATPLVKKFGKKNLALIGIVGFAIFELINYFFTGDSTISFLIINTLSYGFLGLSNTVAFAFVSDVVEYGQWKTGVRSEGIIYSGYSFIRKISQGFAGFIPGLSLTLIGYVANEVQTPETIQGMSNVFFLVPAVISIVGGLIFFFGYSLTDKRHAEIVEELKEKGEF